MRRPPSAPRRHQCSLSGTRRTSHGGQQPITGSLVTVWQAGSSGIGSTATQLAQTTSDTNGNFAFASGASPAPTPAQLATHRSTSPAKPRRIYQPKYSNPNIMILAGLLELFCTEPGRPDQRSHYRRHGFRSRPILHFQSGPFFRRLLWIFLPRTRDTSPSPTPRRFLCWWTCPPARCSPTAPPSP